MGRENIDVNYIKKQFLCCTPINNFVWLKSGEDWLCHMNCDNQKQILDNTLNDDLVTKYPIKLSYQKAFLKFLINELEKNGHEVHDDVYHAYCVLMSSDNEQPLTQYRHFALDGRGTANYITLQESINIVSLGTTGLCSWQAALGLAEWCMANKEVLDGKTILELGSGVGLTGLTVISTCSPKAFTFSDCHPAVLDMLCRNIQTNYPSAGMVSSNEGNLKLEAEHNGVCIRAVRLPWEEVDEQLNESWAVPDLVLAADVLYDSSIFEVLIGALKNLLTGKSSVAIIAATVRNADTISQFLNQLDKHNFTFEEDALPSPQIFIRSDDTPIRIIRIHKSRQL